MTGSDGLAQDGCAAHHEYNLQEDLSEIGARFSERKYVWHDLPVGGERQTGVGSGKNGPPAWTYDHNGKGRGTSLKSSIFHGESEVPSDSASRKHDIDVEVVKSSTPSEDSARDCCVKKGLTKMGEDFAIEQNHTMEEDEEWILVYHSDVMPDVKNIDSNDQPPASGDV